jgi:thiol-disulfide isomerase/thioredoxin
MLLLFAAVVSAQSLGDLARKEKKRREKNQSEGATVRTITDADVRPAPPVVSRPGTELDAEAGGPPPAPTMPAGAPAPNFSLPDRSGRSFSLANFRGRPLLIDFWATWCGPCRQTMPEVQRLHQKYGTQLHVVGINIEGNSPGILSYLAEGNYTFPVLFDSGNWDSTVANDYGVNSIPRTFLIDRNSRVLFAGHPNGLSEEAIQAAIAAR